MSNLSVSRHLAIQRRVLLTIARCGVPKLVTLWRLVIMIRLGLEPASRKKRV